MKLKKLQTKKELVKQLLHLIKPEAIEPWFDKPNKAFDNHTPNEIVKMGRSDLIQDMIWDLESGNPS